MRKGTLDRVKIWADSLVGERHERAGTPTPILGRHQGHRAHTWPRLGGLAWAALTLTVPLLASAQNPSHGPLTFEEGSPLHRLSYTAMMEDGGLTAPGTVVAELYMGLSNIFEQDSSATHVLLLDLERVVTTLTVRWGATGRLELGGRVTLETTGGGVLDGVILAFHERVGFGQANRDRFVEGAYDQRLRKGDGTVFLDIPRKTLGFEDARLFAKLEAAGSDDGRNVLSLKTEIRLPGRSNRAASERVDVALMAVGRLGLGNWFLHGMVGASTVRASTALEPILRGASTFLTLGLERSFGALSAVAQYQAQSPVLKSFDHRELDRAATNMIFGLSGDLGELWSWDASLQEDLPADTPAVDFTLGLRVSRAW